MSKQLTGAFRIPLGGYGTFIENIRNGLCLLFRKGKEKCAGHPLYTFGPDSATMGFDDCFTNGQSQTGALGLAISAGWDG